MRFVYGNGAAAWWHCVHSRIRASADGIQFDVASNFQGQMPLSMIITVGECSFWPNRNSVDSSLCQCLSNNNREAVVGGLGLRQMKEADDLVQT